MRASMAGVTTTEFADLCKKHRFHEATVARQSISPFLERCLALGLVTKEFDPNGSARYTPTKALRSSMSHFLPVDGP